MPTCVICGLERIDLSRHLKEEHQISAEDYRGKYHGEVVDASVDERRKKTCLEVYGNPNYRNEEAKKLSYELYEGGHPLKDPEVRQKAQQTKLELYGDPGFTNREKARQTCLEKYGVDNVGKVKSVKEKAVKTLMERYGRVVNYDFVPPFTKEDLIDLHVNQKMTLGEMGLKYGSTPEVISYWMKKFGIPVTKRIVVSHKREFMSVQEIVTVYFNACLEQNRALSFYEFGKINSQGNMLKMKRIFNTGGKNSTLKDELFLVALVPDKHSEFFKRLIS